MNWKKTSARAPERPRTKGRRAAALAGGILIVLLILFVAGYVLGDPVSLAWARHHAMDYANEQWPGNDFTAVMLDKPAILEVVSRKASAMLSRNVRAVVMDQSARPAGNPRLDQLMNFGRSHPDIVKIQE